MLFQVDYVNPFDGRMAREYIEAIDQRTVENLFQKSGHYIDAIDVVFYYWYDVVDDETDTPIYSGTVYGSCELDAIDNLMQLHPDPYDKRRYTVKPLDELI